MIDRRRFRRYLSQKGAIVMHSEHVGEIINLSMNGLLCQCIVNQAREEMGRGGELELYCGHAHCHLQQVRFKRVSEWTGREEALCSAQVRKCGVEFIELSEDQRERLASFIANHTSF